MFGIAELCMSQMHRLVQTITGDSQCATLLEARASALPKCPLHEEHWVMHDTENCWRRGITSAAQLRGQPCSRSQGSRLLNGAGD
jgi:hypothetical protein